MGENPRYPPIIQLKHICKKLSFNKKTHGIIVGYLAVQGNHFLNSKK